MNNKHTSSNSQQLPEGASISRPSPPFVRLRGSHSSNHELVAMRKPRSDEDPGPSDPEDPDPDPIEDPPPPPPPPISTPDLAIQLLICLDPDVNDRLISAVRGAIDANADVRSACINGTQRVGVWLRPVVNNRDNDARQAGLAQLNILAPNETMAFFINSSLIRRQAFDAWNAAAKRLNGSGDPDPNGPVHLTSFSVSFESPNRIVTRIDGFDERPWPDVDFRLTTTDTLVATGDGLICERQRDLDVDTGWLTFLTVLFTLTLPPLGIVFLVQRIIVGSKDAPDTDSGVGDNVLAMIPKEILIPGGQKVVALYQRLEVSGGGVFAGGVVDILPRRPEVSIHGPHQISVSEGSQSVSRTYTLRTVDLRPPFEDAGVVKFLAKVVGTGGTGGPLGIRPRIEWSGSGTPLRPKAESTVFQFDVDGLQAGDIAPHRVSVTVVDSDGLTASADLTVNIHGTPPLDEGDEFPPVCRLKPWLPECQEPMLRARSARRGKGSGKTVKSLIT